MPQYNPSTPEQVLELWDGRTIFKTHNGFKSWLKDQKGEVITITDFYYNKVKRYAIHLKV